MHAALGSVIQHTNYLSVFSSQLGGPDEREIRPPSSPQAPAIRAPAVPRARPGARIRGRARLRDARGAARALLQTTRDQRR